MSFAMIILLPILAAFGFLYWSEQLSEEHVVLKGLFQLLFIPFLLLSIHFSVIYAGLVWVGDAEMVAQLANFAWYISLLFYGIGIYILIWLAIKVIDMIKSSIAQKKEEKYG